jgi:hypothetical protein
MFVTTIFSPDVIRVMSPNITVVSLDSSQNMRMYLPLRVYRILNIESHGHVGHVCESVSFGCNDQQNYAIM